MRRVDIVTFHFPPQGGAGSLRLLSFARHLPAFGWKPRILTVGDLGGGAGDATLAERLPDDVSVERWFTPLAAWPYGKTSPSDGRRTRLVRSLVRRALAPVATYPDPALLWSVATGWRLGRSLREDPPDVFMTSSPPHSLHAAGLIAATAAPVPWAMDLRDPWESNRPFGVSGLRHAAGDFLESRALRNAACVLANTPRLAAHLAAGMVPSDRIVVLPNGYDEDEIEVARVSAHAETDGPFTIVHAGAFYAGQRDPLEFLAALAKAREVAGPRRGLRFLLPGDSAFHRKPALLEKIRSLGLEDVVRSPGYVPHGEVLAMMARADLLLLIQGQGFHLQVPSKAYEYLAVGRPVLAITGEGATADVVRSSAVGTVVPPADPDALVRSLITLLQRPRDPDPPPPPPTVLSRRAIAERLAGALSRAAAVKRVY